MRFVDFVAAFRVIENVSFPCAVKRCLECLSLEVAAARDSVNVSVGESRLLRKSFLVYSDNHVQVPLLCEVVAVFDHFGNFVVRVDVDERKGNVTEKRLFHKPEQNSAVLSD